MRALYQERGSSEEDEEEVEQEDMMVKLKHRMSGLFKKDKTPKEEVEAMKKQAN